MDEAPGRKPPPAEGRRSGGAAAEWLADFALAHGTPFAGGANRPLRLDDADALWFIARGSVNVFVAREQDGEFVEFKHLLRAGCGRLVFPTEEGPNALVAKGLPDSELRRVSRTDLLAAGGDGAVVEQVELWIAEISATVALDVTYRPPPQCFVAAGATVDPDPGTVVSAKRGVVWVSGRDGGLAFLDTEDAGQTGSGFVPVAPGSWVSVSRPTRLRGVSSRELHRAGRLFAALADFHRLALAADDLNRRLLLADAANLRAAQTRYRRESVDAARRQLFEVLETRGPEREPGDALRAALDLVGRGEGIRFRTPPAPRGSRDPAETGTGPCLDRILTASGVRGRKVTLHASDHWWLGDSGSLLAFRREDGAPIALLPGRFGRYRMVDPTSGRTRPVDAGRAAALQSDAIFFYQPLPSDRTSGADDLARIGFRRWKGDVFRFVAAGLLAGLAMLVPSILLGVFADEVAPAGRVSTLAWLTGGTLLLALAAGLLQMQEGTALMRLEGRVAARVTAALWDRLLDLPAAFFRSFTSGDLGVRAMAFQSLRDQVSGVVMGALLSTIFLLPTFALLFLYDVAVGWLGLAGGLLVLSVTVTLGARQIPHHRRLMAAQRSLAGVLLQLIGAADKLRATGKEWTAFTRWARDYREQTRSAMEVGALNEHLVAFTAMTPLLATATLFAVAIAMQPTLSTGVFLTVYAAYMVFMSAITALGHSMSGVAAIVPAVEQVAPILEAAPKSASADAVVPELRGGIRLDRVSFRYSGDGPAVLRDLSFEVRPGEFVALVGGSGAGKSTVLRIILGLEEPTSGIVSFDGHNLDRINRRALPRQIGVVAQDGSLRPRTICDNIIGIATDLTVDDAWRAARLAAVDRDIRAMPMGMFTVVTENSAVFSGGQIQRILLAAALVRSPRVLLLDEATSWLDNETQATVMGRIEELAVTRIVIAHRLSTIRKADRIYVLDEGRLAQQGTYAHLIETPGIFRDLAHRQLA